MVDEPQDFERYAREQLEELFDMTVEEILAMAHRMARRACDTSGLDGQEEDIVQDAMIKLFLHACKGTGSRNPITNPVGYIKRTVVNATISQARQKDRIGWFGKSRTAEFDGETPRIKDPGIVPMNEGIRTRFLANLIHRELLELPAHLRRTSLTMWSPQTLGFDKVTAQEAARSLGIGYGTVRQHLVEVRRTIRENLPELEDILRDPFAR